MTSRMAKVQELAREILGEEIQELKDPRIGFVTVTSVKVSADLRHARVYVSVLGSEEERARTMEGLRSAGRHLKAELGRQMRTKYLPDLTFELDLGAQEAQRLETIFREMREDG